MNQDNLELPTAKSVVQGSFSNDPNHPLYSVKNTDWFNELEFIDVFVASKEELETLKESAPSTRVRDWLCGIIDTRNMFASVTGSPF